MANIPSPTGELKLQNHRFNGRHDAIELDPAIAEDMADAMQPHLYAQLDAETIISVLGDSPDNDLDLTSETGEKIQLYLDEQRAQEIDRDVVDEAVTADEYLADRLWDYYEAKVRRDEIVRGGFSRVTNGFSASVAERSAASYKAAGKWAANLVYLKHAARANIHTLESYLSEDDQVIYGSQRPNRVVALMVDNDSEARDLLQRVSELTTAYKRRCVIERLAQIFGTEVRADFSRDDVEAIDKLLDGYGERLVI